MIVTCESCGTKFKVDTTKVKKDKIKVRCSRCRHVFTLDLAPAGDEQQKSEKVIVLDDSFDDDVEKVSARTETASDDFPPLSDETEEEIDKASERISKKPLAAKRPSYFAVNKLVVVGIVILAIAGLLGYKYLSKKSGTIQPEQDLSQPTKATVQLNPQTQAFFIENVQVGQILVVQGEVTNKSNTNISFVLLEGKLIGTNGKPLLSQRFYAGNIMTKEELAQLTVDKIQERMMRREGNNLSNVRIKPGDKVSFMVVFYNLPPIDELSDYSIEFVSAEAEKPAGAQQGAEKTKSQ